MTSGEPVTNRDVAKGVGTTLLARLGGIIDIIAQPLYVWMFGLAAFGLYTVLWVAVNLAENVADLGSTSALQRVVPQARDEAEAVAGLRAALLIGLLPCLVLALATTLAAGWLAPLINVAPADVPLVPTAIALFAWALPLWAFVEIATSALRARRVFGAEIRLRLFWEQVIRLALAVLFWMMGMGLLGLLVAHLLSLAITSVLCVRLLARYYDLSRLGERPLSDPVTAETLRAGLAVLPSNMVARVFSDVPALILNALLPGSQGAVAAGLFAIARKISSVVQLVRIAFSYVLAPLASTAVRGGAADVQVLFAYATRLTFAIVVPLAGILAAAGPAILRLFGPEAQAALPALVVLIVGRMLEAVTGAATPIQQVISRYNHQLVASLTGIAAALACGWWLVGQHGLTGMAAAVAIGFVVASAVPLVQLHRYEAIHPFEPPFGRVALITLALTGAVLILIRLLNRLPDQAELPAFTLILLATLWCSCRLALPGSDRHTMGGLARRLRLV